MGLMDKFKNLFTDEEIIEEDDIEEPVKIKEIKKEEKVEDKLPTFMREKIEKEEKSKESIKKPIMDFEVQKEIELEPKHDFNTMDTEIKKDSVSDFKFPVFDESDFVEPSRLTRQAMRSAKTKEEVKPSVREQNKKSIAKPVVKSETKVSELYKDKKKTTSEEKKFRATPIISPIYGVLDKNYVPDDVETNKGDNYEISRHSKNVDFDSVRKKAYGSLTDDIKENLMCENCEYLREAKACKKDKKLGEDNLMYEALCDKEEDSSYNDVTLDEATENYYDYGVEYEKVKETKPYYEKNSSDDVNIVNHAEEDVKHKTKEVPPVKSSINLLSTLKKSMGEEDSVNNINDNITKKKNKEENLELTDDLFSLIDSMYEERDD